MNKDKKSSEVVVLSVRPEGRTTTINTLFISNRSRANTSTINSSGTWILLECTTDSSRNGQQHLSAKLRTADIFIFLMIIRSTLFRKVAHGHTNIRDTGQRKQKLEPVSSTSRRGARAAYHDEYLWDFGPRIAYTVSLAADISRPPIWQGGRPMSAPRPYETYPFHQPALFTLWSISLYLQNCSSYFFHVVFAMCLKTLYFCNLRMRSSEPVVSRISVILRSFCRLCGTYWYEIQRDTLQLDTDPLQYGVGIVNGWILGKEAVLNTHCMWGVKEMTTATTTTTPKIHDLIGWIRKINRAARFNFSCNLWRSLPEDDVKVSYLRFWRQRKPAAIIFHSMPLHKNHSCQTNKSALRLFRITWQTDGIIVELLTKSKVLV